VGGLLLLALPLRLHRGRPVHGALRLLVPSGAALSPVLALLVAFGPGPGTAYNGAVFSPDFFGQPAEARAAGEAAALEAAHAELLARGAERVAGPVELLAWPAPTLVELPRGLGAAVLGPILDAWLSRGAVDHVVLFAADAAALREAAGTGPSSHLVTLARWPGAPGDDVLLLATGSR
jgi:hypothetical protein